ncbi:MAG: sugar ABC transporter substrate-binding protein [Anaerolineales bacterium]|nr:sugar ABC transporter substrate-binding protein [Anaerolineales bacterium]MCB9128026.1 sugar ABC transporter substrate-binding protein [Ardenticatenales bacterium]MCB9172042.1 sugar ABC transporter substrate-binding protein [Ardenticatenales bacterium]
MIKRFPLLILVLTLLMVACSGLPSSGDAPTTVTFMTFGDPAEKAAYEALVAAFEAEHDDIDVQITHIPSASDYRSRLATDFAAGTPPDISLMNFRRYAPFAANDQLEPLTDYLAESEIIAEADFFPITLVGYRWNGALMCIPQNISSLVVYYNKDLFEAAGVAEPADDWTWDDFLAAAKALTRDTDGDGTIDQYGLGTEASLFRLAPFVWQNGGLLVDSETRPSTLSLYLPESTAATQWFVELQTVHHVVPDRISEESLDSESRFIQGTTAMYLNSRRGTPTYREIDAFTWDVAPLPRGVEQAGVLHSDGYCMSKTTANKEAAWRFIEYANSPAGQAVIARTGRTVPSLIAVADSPAFLDETQPPSRARVFLDTAETLRLVPVISTWEEIEKSASSEIERAFYGEISVEEAIQLATQRTEEYFAAGVVANPRR